MLLLNLQRNKEVFDCKIEYNLKRHLELKGKLGADTVGVAASGQAPTSSNDVMNALLALGYNEKEAAHATRQLPAGLTVSDGIRQALKLLSKG